MLNKPFITHRLGGWRLLHNVLNEVLNGFVLDNFEAVVGMSKSELNQLLEYLHALPDGADVDLNLVQIVTFRNALRETLRELGIEEFSTRTGYDFEIGEEVLGELNRLIEANERH
jgi:hypothetical protein